MSGLIGIDFGTTNSVVAIPAPDGRITTARFAFGAETLDTFRTVLCFWEDRGTGRALRHTAGPHAIETYLDDAPDSRLIMSMKTYLAQRSFTETRVFGRAVTLERLVALFLRALLDAAGLDPGRTRVVAGRPVRFAGETADDTLGEARLRAAFAGAGIDQVDVALEPEAAGYRFARTLTTQATVLIGDFGGGTSDFSLLRFEPGAPGRVASLGHAGIGIAGDTFDYRIIDHVVSPRLGKGGSYTVMGKALPVPPEYFSSFARWHRLSLMRAPRTLREIGEVARLSADPEPLRGLIRLIEEEQGYQLYRTVSAVKTRLSAEESAMFRFRCGDVAIEQRISRAEFEDWISPDLARLDATVGQALVAAGVGEREVDRVFLTGGTSFVPAVRRLFERRFGPDKVSAGGEFVSVAEGLALIGQDREG
jgi:hypothetical chaperone protein